MEVLALGVIIGILLSIFVAILHFRYAQPVIRAAKQAESVLKRKGSLLDPEDESLTSWVEQLPHEPAPQE